MSAVPQQIPAGAVPLGGAPRQIGPTDLEGMPLEVIWQNFGPIFRKDNQDYPLGYPQHVKRLFAPIDNIHLAITSVVGSARLSLACGMFGWDDDEIDQIFRSKLEDEQIPVQLSLDKRQAGGAHEKAILKRWQADQIGNSVAIGNSSKGAISHVKLIVVDGIITIQGSTNLSATGENLQNNECTFILDPVFAAEKRARLDKIHDEMLMQMARARGGTKAAKAS